ncbi:MAG TPA: PIG-L family deacetylase [Verrucomicrobiae bacterium]|jgi:LmbE family N-acetylglucosaminyl deacetylase|nr:PIG-L family deacetylase [Verrucomicrobiae bacterium]
MSDAYHQFVSEFERLFKKAKHLPSGGLKNSARSKIPASAPKALIFSPHPDDECIVGGLALRLLREAKWNVANVAVTLGSKKERRIARLRELKNACDCLGFDLTVAGFEKINLETRNKNRAQWKSAVQTIAKILAAQKPHVIFVPHEADGHPTHIGVHFLLLDALKTLPKNFKCFVVETEFWGQMASPNLLVESSIEDVGDLVAALSLHIGEVKRNPYHARLPAWMLDNVRRGAELVGGAGAATPDFTFGTVYRLQKWRGGKLRKVFNGGRFLSAKENAAGLFR